MGISAFVKMMACMGKMESDVPSRHLEMRPTKDSEMKE